MNTLNIRGALVFSAVFLALAFLGSVYFPSDTDVHFSVESGFYDDPIVLEMTCAVPGADIYYTTDGSVPTTSSQRYTEGLLLQNAEGLPNNLSAYIDASINEYAPEESMVKGHVIRAKAFWDKGGESAVYSGSYFIGVDRQAEYGSVPIMSLIVEEDDFFDYENGIYTLGKVFDEWYAEQSPPAVTWWTVNGNFHMRGHEWERPVFAEYFPADGSAGFSQEMGVRIKGGVSRGHGHKSLRLTARNEYGHNRVTGDLFGTGVEENKSFVLRSGGNDCESTKIREPLVQNLARNMRLDTQYSQPCITFINGEYWGLYTLNEEYSAHFIENRYDIQHDNVIVVKTLDLEEGMPGEEELFVDMLRFAQQNDQSIDENYRRMNSMLDIGSFADYAAVQIYTDNQDGMLLHDNNWQAWRVRTTDSSKAYGDERWRMMLYDIDQSASREADYDNLTPALFGNDDIADGYHQLLELLRSFYQNGNFRRELILSLCDVRNIHFSPQRFCEEMGKLRNVYEPLMPESLYRFGPSGVIVEPEIEELYKDMLDNYNKGSWANAPNGVAQYCADQLDTLEAYFLNRWEVFPRLMQQSLNLQSPASLHLSCVGDGAVMVNHSVPDMPNGYTGLYFPDYPITLTALENGEGRFVRWEGEGCEIADPYAMSTEIAFEGDFTVRAVFE